MCKSLVLKRRGFVNDVTPFEGTVSTNFSWHLTDQRHLADIPRYMMCGEKRAQVWMERNKGKIKMTFIYIHIFFALKIQSYSYSFHAMPTNTNTVLLPCAFDMVSAIPLSIWGIVSRRLSCNKKTWHVFIGFVSPVVLGPVVCCLLRLSFIHV